MPRPASASAPDLRQGMQAAYTVDERMNQLVLKHLDDHAWRAQIRGGKGTHHCRRLYPPPQFPLQVASPIGTVPHAAAQGRLRTLELGKNSGRNADPAHRGLLEKAV